MTCSSSAGPRGSGAACRFTRDSKAARGGAQSRTTAGWSGGCRECRSISGNGGGGGVVDRTEDGGGNNAREVFQQCGRKEERKETTASKREGKL